MEEEKKKGGWGGKRAGAGRKKGKLIGHVKENPKCALAAFRVSEKTLNRIKQLRDLTKHDTAPFNNMFEEWVAQLASDYGLEE